MSTVRELHSKSVELAHLALVARQIGETAKAVELAKHAYELESQAANLVPDGRSSEPTRSILFRSAASLAFQCREYDSSLRLIAQALTGYPPKEVEGELVALLEQVRFEQSLHEERLSLTDIDLDFILKGSAVGYGHVLYDEFIDRLKFLRTIVDRWFQRKLGRTYQSGGRVANIYRPVVPVLESRPAGSFAIKIKFGVAEGQQTTFLANPAEIVDEVVTGFDLLNGGDSDGLRQLIPDVQYYNNFITLARQIAPDGERITSLTLGTSRKTIGFTRKRNEIAPARLAPSTDESPMIRAIEIEGELDYAVKRGQNIIGLTTERGDQYRILIDEGTDDVVRAYFGQQVKVTGNFDGENVSQPDITPLK